MVKYIILIDTFVPMKDKSLEFLSQKSLNITISFLSHGINVDNPVGPLFAICIFLNRDPSIFKADGNRNVRETRATLKS